MEVKIDLENAKTTHGIWLSSLLKRLSEYGNGEINIDTLAGKIHNDGWL